MTTQAGTDVHRLCVFDLALDCGHIATAAVDGWYPVTVSCCDRLGGTFLRGTYVPFASHVEYVKVLSERYEHRPHSAARDASRIIGRRARTNDPRPRPHSRADTSARFSARVGATRQIPTEDLHLW